ncbi:vWA domain-containing protein [Mageeibacillus indolicus]|nr:vWA domain-containing protein [Mageeibacillus indolicus]
MKPLVKNTISILSAGLLALGSAIYPNFVSAVEVSNSILEKNNKTASPLDNNLETKVTLSFPGSEDVLAQDIVFVLDKSGASDQKGIDSQARQFLDDIKQQADEKGLNIKIGIVNFYYAGKVRQELTDVVKNYNDIQNKLKSSVLGFGTNMHAGLLAAKKMLDDDTAVAAKNKHIILISDGATYLYSKNNDFTTAYTRSFNPTKQKDPNVYNDRRDLQGGIWEYQSRDYNLKIDWKKFNGTDVNFIFSYAMGGSWPWDPNKPENKDKPKPSIKYLGEYLDYYRQQEQDTSKNWAQYDYAYTFFSRRKGGGKNGVVPIENNAPANIDIAFMKADDVFQEMVNAGYQMNVYYKNKADFNGSLFLKYLARNSNDGKLNKDFQQLKKEVLEKVAKGSTVVDYIGKDFDFVNDVGKISLKVGTAMLQAEEIKDRALAGSDAHYGFGKNNDNTYRFELIYKKVDADAANKETLTLKINETVYPKIPVVLEYQEKLVKKPTAPGIYKLDTNEKATLYPVDANNNKGTPVDFPQPQVTYKVEGGNFDNPDPSPFPFTPDPEVNRKARIELLDEVPDTAACK